MGFAGVGWREPGACHGTFLGAAYRDTELDHDLDQKLLEEEAQKLVALPPVQFAGFILTMMFTKILHPRGIKDMVVVVNGSVIALGEKEVLQNVLDAKTALAGEIAKIKGNA